MSRARGAHRRRLDDYAARIVDRAATARLTPADLRNTKLSWYTITNQDAEAATVYVYDEVGGTFGVDAAQFAADLAEITAPTVHVRINSPGGSLFDGIAIYNSLLSHPAKVVVHVDSLAASIASVIAMAGDEVAMGPGSQLMIHDAMGIELGNAEDHTRMATFLDRQSDNIAEIYQRRAGGDAGEWRQRMLDETWLFASEAIALGLADRVDEAEPDEAEDDLDAELRALMTRTHSLNRFHYGGREAAPTPAVRNSAGRPRKPAARAPKVADVACPTHHTDTVDSRWNAGTHEGRLPSPMPVATARAMYGYYDAAFVEAGAVPKDGCRLPHHEVAADGTPGPANLTGVRDALARLPQSEVPASEQAAVRAHLQAHLDDAPVEDRAELELPTDLGDVFRSAMADVAAEPFHFDADVFRTALRDRAENAPAPPTIPRPATPVDKIDVNDLVSALMEGLR